jgi:hypothetical protein
MARYEENDLTGRACQQGWQMVSQRSNGHRLLLIDDPRPLRRAGSSELLQVVTIEDPDMAVKWFK